MIHSQGLLHFMPHGIHGTVFFLILIFQFIFFYIYIKSRLKEHKKTGSRRHENTLNTLTPLYLRYFSYLNYFAYLLFELKEL